MREWTIHVEGKASVEMNDVVADALVGALGAYAPALSYLGTSVDLTVTVEAETVQEAVQQLGTALSAATANLSLIRVEAEQAV